MSKFMNGAKVRVKDKGERYSSYKRFVEEHARDYLREWNPRESLENGTVGVVVAQAKHQGTFDRNHLYVIKTSDGVFVMGECGLEPAEEPKILITTDGTTTLARLYEGKKVVRSAEAKCAPSDTFDFAVGANLAYDRLMDRLPATPPKAEKPAQEPIKLYCVKDCKICGCVKKGNVYEQDKHGFFDGKNGLQLAEPVIRNGYLIPLVKRPAKVGEYILVTNSDGRPTNPYKNGDVLKVVDDCFSIGVGINEYHIIYHSEYLVLDGYKG